MGEKPARIDGGLSREPGRGTIGWKTQDGGIALKKRAFKILAAILICWGLFVTAEGFRLIGSTDPGRYPLIHLGGLQVQDELAEYGSIGFSQEYHLTKGDTFVYGEFRVLGIRIARWEA